jgi:hypothetical protein
VVFAHRDLLTLKLAKKASNLNFFVGIDFFWLDLHEVLKINKKIFDFTFPYENHLVHVNAPHLGK